MQASSAYFLTGILAVFFLFLLGVSLIFLWVFLLFYFVLYPVFFPVIRNRLKKEELADRRFSVQTADGWYLPLYYHEPRYPRKYALPVILVHGIAQNRNALDLDGFRSLAVYLRLRGFPVFVAGLRGTEHSRSITLRKPYFTFDDYVIYDAPAIIRRVLELTDAPAVNWIGYSLGGMIGYGIAGLNHPVSGKIRTLITLGSPLRIDFLTRNGLGYFLRFPRLSGFLPMKAGARLLYPLFRWVFPFHDFFYNPRNTDRKTAQSLLFHVAEPVNAGVIQQFAFWIREKKELSMDRLINYRENLRNIKCPVLLISGSADRVVPPSEVQFVYDSLGTPEKKLVVAGKSHGFREDYGHLCLIAGEYAPTEIFPVILDWLEKHGMEKPQRIRNFFRRLRRRWELRKLLKQSIKTNRQKKKQ